MAASTFMLVKAFLREATEDAGFGVISDAALAYARLREIQRGNFEATTESGTTLVSSTVGGKQFSFTVAAGLSPAEIITTAERALEMMEGKTVPQIRALLRRRTRTRPDFSAYCPS
jgi:hypothetical protein